jgi:hypothetical protein
MGCQKKLSSPPRHSALACRARLPYTLRRDPWASEASPALHRIGVGRISKMLPLSLQGLLVHHNIIDLYIDGTNLTAISSE